jgi:hypothetical protein
MSELKVNKISANDGTDTIKIDSKLGIGATTAKGLLSINGSDITGIPGIFLTGFSDSELDIAVTDGQTLQIGEWDDSTTTATMNAKIGGSTGDFYTNDGTVSNLSDERVKTNINVIQDSLEDVLSLRPVSFEFTGEGQMRTDLGIQFGFIAQEIETVFPDIMKTDTRLNNDGIETEYKSLPYTKLIPFLVSAIQGQHGQIEDLKLRILELENNNI